jgi:hypothetical protein
MPAPSFILVLRLGGAVLASAVFGLVAAIAFQPWGLWTAIGLGFLFGTAFMVGTGYRILIAVALRRMQPAPVSWSGATCGTAVLTVILGLVMVASGESPQPVWLAFGLAINIAYLPIKTACLKVGCCQAVRPFVLGDLRLAEIGLAALLVVLSGTMALFGLFRLAALLAIGGHFGIRLLSRLMRGRWSWGWPPMTQPGAELAPLIALILLVLVQA